MLSVLTCSSQSDKSALTKPFYFIDPCPVVVSPVMCSIVCIFSVCFASVVITMAIVFCIPVMIFISMSICIVAMAFMVRGGTM